MDSGRFGVSSGSIALWSGVRLPTLSIPLRDHDSQQWPPHSLMPHLFALLREHQRAVSAYIVHVSGEG